MATPRLEDGVDLADKTDDVIDLDDDLEEDVVDDVAAEPDLDVDLKEELLAAEDDGESWSDDPVRMYLTQMGEIPLLTRQQEIALAKEIEITRSRFRRKLLECDYVIQSAVKVLKRVHDGELPFDRTVQVSVTDRLEKDQILGRLPHNLRTLEVLLKRNRRDYRMALSQVARRWPSAARPGARLGRRRSGPCGWSKSSVCGRSGSRPMIRTLEEFSRRVDELKAQIDAHKRAKLPCRSASTWSASIRNILLADAGNAHQPAQPRALSEVGLCRVPAGQARLVRRQPAAGRLDRQEVPQPRPELPGPDPGRQRRPDAGRR